MEKRVDKNVYVIVLSLACRYWDWWDVNMGWRV